MTGAPPRNPSHVADCDEVTQTRANPQSVITEIADEGPMSAARSDLSRGTGCDEVKPTSADPQDVVTQSAVDGLVTAPPATDCNKDNLAGAAHQAGIANVSGMGTDLVQGVAPTIESISLEVIRVDADTQSRVQLDKQTISDYADAIREGVDLPPVVLYVTGSVYWLADGFHRMHAYRAAGKTSIPAEIRRGTKRDAVLFSVGANAKHGLRRTNADKRRAVETLLKDADWAQWSNNYIAEKCAVSQPFVASVRRSLETVSSEKPAEQVAYKTKHGTQATMKTGAIGKARKAREPLRAAEPPATPEERPPAEDLPPGLEPGDTPTLSDIVDELRRENEQKDARIKALSADDTAAKLDYEIKIRQGAEVRLADEMEKNYQFQRQFEDYRKWYDDLRKITGLQQRDEITHFVREAQKAKESAL